MLSLIVAYGKNREIGLNGTMPWHLSGDFQHVKDVTMGKTILMGQRTFESLPGVLPKRIHLVVSDDPNFTKDHKRVKIYRDLIGLLEECKASEEEIIVFGGGSIYKASLPYVDKMYITRIDQGFDADTYFPEWDESEWEITEESETIVEEEASYRFVTYERKKQA